MPSPKCSECERELTDWHGNVMVDDNSFMKYRIDHIFVLCKECTLHLDRTGVGREFHNLWELNWLRTQFFYYIGRAIHDTMSESPVLPKWSKAALNEVCKLGEFLETNEIDDFLKGFISE